MKQYIFALILGASFSAANAQNLNDETMNYNVVLCIP